MSRNNINISDQWPFYPRYLTEKVPEELITIVITGISERLSAPVVLFQPSVTEDLQPRQPFCPIYPVDLTHKLYNYPKFCVFFQTQVPGGEQLCFEDGCLRSQELFKTGDKDILIDRCHLGLTNCMMTIEMLGRPLALCTSGKFIRTGDSKMVRKRLEKLEKAGKLTSDHRKQLEKYAENSDCRRDLDHFKRQFREEMTHLNNMVERYLLQDRREKEQLCIEEVIETLYRTPEDPENLREGLEKVLSKLRGFLSVRYLALFLGLKEWNRVLPLVAQDGLNWQDIGSCHFNWGKAGLPSIRKEEFIPTDWISTIETQSGFPEDYIKKGLKGPNSGMFCPATFLLPVGRQYRGVLIVGEWVCTENNTHSLLAGSTGARDFLQRLGQLLFAHAISKRSVYASSQHDRRRDIIVALTAHSIRSALHRLWDSIVKIKRHLKSSDYYSKIVNINEGMEQNIRAMKKKIELSMEAPSTSVYPEMDKSEMEIEDINIAALIYNIVDMLSPVAISKQIVFVISDEVSNLPLFRGDRYMLELVFSNIIENAVKYSARNKEVRIYPYRDAVIKGDIHMVISDIGWGIPEEDIKKIFDPAYKSSQVHKMHPRGIGLGLFQARQFMDLHEGEIWAISRPAVEGADLKYHKVQFHIKMPTKYKVNNIGGR